MTVCGEAKMPEETGPRSKKDEIMGFARPVNALWLLLLFVGTWALWSLQAAWILLAVFIAAAIAGVILRRNER
jgi:hypothetical protein